MKTLIIAPQFVTKVGDYYSFPLGLAYVSAVLKRAGYDVATLNLNYIEPEACGQVIRAAIEDQQIDVVASGGLSAHYHSLQRVVDAVRSAERDVKLVLGGGLISSEPELMCEALDGDAAVIGEGEVTSVDLWEALESGRDLGEVLGIVYRDAAGGIRRNEPRPYIETLDDSPMPDYEGFDVDRYLDMQQTGDFFHLNKFDNPRLLPVILSRSCPFNCTFCYHPLGKKYRRRSLDNFFDELDTLVEKYDINMLGVLDELFSLDKEIMVEFCERMKQYNLLWTAQLRVDRVDRETLSMLKDSGLFYISYGIESASQTVLDSMRKHTTVEQIDNALAITRELGIGIQGNLIMGDPAETVETAAETIEWWRRNYHYHINFATIIPFPGSVLYEDSVKRGLIPDRLKYIEDGCPSLNMTVLSDEDYGSIFRDVLKATSEVKQFALDVNVVETRFDPVKNIQLYQLRMTCPHCKTRNTYNDFHYARPELFKLVCRNCNQRSDIALNWLPSFRETWGGLVDELEELAARGTPVSVTPVLHEAQLAGRLHLLGFDWQKLNFHCALDFNQSREGEEFMGLPIIHRSPENIRERCADDHFFILQSARPDMVLQDLLDNGVDLERITYLGSKFGLPGLVRPYTKDDMLQEIKTDAAEGR